VSLMVLRPSLPFIARMRRHHRCANDFIRTLANVDAHEAFCFAVENRAVFLAQLLREGVHSNALFFRLPFVKTDVSDFRRGVSAPRDDERTGLGTAHKEGVPDDDTRHEVSDMGKLIR